MAKITKEESVATPRIKKIYTDSELRAFGEEVKKYRIEKTLSTGEKITMPDFKQYYVDQGALTKEGAVVAMVDMFDGIIQPMKFAVLEEKVSQYCSWKARGEYGQLMRLKQLEKEMPIAEKMKAGIEVNTDDIPF